MASWPFSLWGLVVANERHGVVLNIPDDKFSFGIAILDSIRVSFPTPGDPGRRLQRSGVGVCEER